MSSLSDLVYGKVSKVDLLGPPPWGMRITGIGGYVPPLTYSNQNLAAKMQSDLSALKLRAAAGECDPLTEAVEKKFETSDDWISSRTHIRERHITMPYNATSDLAVKAVITALDTAAVSLESIDFLICGTVTPDYFSTPPTATVILKKLGLEPIEMNGDAPVKILNRVMALDVAAACSTFVETLLLAYGMIRSGLYRRGVVIGADTLERAANQCDRDTCVLFGSGAGVFVVEAVPIAADAFNPQWIDAGSDGRFAEKIIREVGGSAKPYTPEIMRQILRQPWHRPDLIWQEGGFVFEFMVKFISGVYLPDLLERTGLKRLDAIDHVFFHQANGRMIESMMKRYQKLYPDDCANGLPRVHISLDRYGNTSSPTVPLGFYDVVEQDWLDQIAAAKEGREPSPVLKIGDRCLTCVFGGGLTWASSVFTYTGVRAMPLEYQNQLEHALLAV